MPSRLIREGIVESRRMAELCDSAKVLYYKLLSVADDYGRFEADPELLRRKLFMWETDRITAENISSWLSACRAGQDPLIHTYSINGRSYLEILKFGQQIRSKSKFPDPCLQLLTTDNNCSQLCCDPNTNTNTNSVLSSKETSTAEIQTANPTARDDFDQWPALLEIATRAEMNFSDYEARELRTGVWARLDTGQRLAAIQGIGLRIESGEFEEAYYVPALAKYLRERRWLRKPRAPMGTRKHMDVTEAEYRAVSGGKQ